MSASALDSQYLTFRLDEELFAFDIAKVREVLEFSASPRCRARPTASGGHQPPRGMSCRCSISSSSFGFQGPEKPSTMRPHHGGLWREVVLGGLARWSRASRSPPFQASILRPGWGRVQRSCIRGMGKRDDQFLMILDVDRVLTIEDLQP